MTLLLDREAVRAGLAFEPLLEALRTALVDTSAGRASAPPRIAVRSAAGLVAAMPGVLPEVLGAKLVSVFRANHDRGLPSHQGLITLFDAADGRPLAILDGTEITAARTAAVAALSVRELARRQARVLTVIGTGVQARAHLAAVRRMRAFERVWVAGRNPAHVRTVARECEAEAAESVEAAVRRADVVCACTDATEPVVRRAWLKAGAHVTSVGMGAELDPETVGAGLLTVESRVAFDPFPAGAPELQGRDRNAAAELGEVFAGTRPGRVGEDQITVQKSVGHAVEDAAAAWLAYTAARRSGRGMEFAFDPEG